MMLKTITCSGANEHTNLDELIALLDKFPKSELGIQVSGKKASFGSARYWWIEALYRSLYHQKSLPKLALHINSDWVERFAKGDVADELRTFLNWNTAFGKPVFKRVQLNFKIGREEKPDMIKMLNAIKQFQGTAEEERVRFIFSYNNENAKFLDMVHYTGLKFDLLCDSSHGEGILPTNYLAPVYPDVEQGYSGGISPENVLQQLELIARVVPAGSSFNIDAEGKLKGEDGHLSLAKAEEYLKLASAWAAH